jgi:hypothetical protein
MGDGHNGGGRERKWFSVPEFAKAVGYSTQRVYQYIKDGKIQDKHLDNRGKGHAKRRIKMAEALQDLADTLIMENRNHGAEHAELPEARKTVTDPAAETHPHPSTRGAAVEACGFGKFTLTEAQAESARQKAAQLKMKNDVEAGKLIDAKEAERQAFDAARLTRDAVLAVPDRLAAELASITEVHEINDVMTRELTQALEGLAGVEA